MLRYSMMLFTVVFFCVGIAFTKVINNSVQDSTDYSDSSSAFRLIEYDFNKSFKDGLDIISAPAHFSLSNWIAAGAIVGTTGLSMLLDNSVRSVVKKNHTAKMDDFNQIGKYYGEVVPAVSLSAGLYALGLIFHERSFSLTGRLLAESLLYAGTTVVLLKYLFSRSRPYNNVGNTDFGDYHLNNNDYFSLPSGHTAVAFTVSSVLANRINNIYATIGLYSLALITGYQRIYSDNHWISDTVLSAAIGIVISRTVVGLNEQYPFESDNVNVSVKPLFNSSGFGFNLSFAF